MANKLHPHHKVALMTYILPTKQASSLGSIDPPCFNAQHWITNKGQRRVRTFPILDAIASLSAFQGGSQAVVVGLESNTGEEAIRLTINGNQYFGPCLVHHVQSVWEICALYSMSLLHKEDQPRLRTSH